LLLLNVARSMFKMGHGGWTDDDSEVISS
jgi:hypothetical protein